MDRIEGANAIVTGASRGLGVAIAEGLAERGARVALAARSADALGAVQQRLASRGSVAIAVPADVTRADDRQHLLDRVEAELGGVDILVNNAGIDATVPFHHSDPDELARLVEVNLIATMLLTRLVVPGMVQRRRGHVVNVASLAGKVGVPFKAGYSASKSGLIGFTESLRAEYVDDPVGFSSVCPGFVAEEGMYAAFEARGIEPPRLVGKSTPARVADATVACILGDRAEALVNPVPMRPTLALGAVLPGVLAPLVKRLGLHRMLARVAADSAT